MWCNWIEIVWNIVCSNWEWNENRNLAPGFMREEETRVCCCYLRWVTGKTVRGGRLRFRGDFHTREDRKGGGGESPKRETSLPEEHLKQHSAVFSSFWLCKFATDKRSNFDDKSQSFLFVSWLRASKVPIHPQFEASSQPCAENGCKRWDLE